MRGLSFKATEAIEKIIQKQFDDISLRFLGLIPKVTKQKRIVFSTSKNNIMSLFFQSLGTSTPNQLEKQTIRTLMRIASGYIDGLKERTTARVINNVDSYIKNKSSQEEPVEANEVSEIVSMEMDKAKHQFKMIANTESNKASNTGTALQITRIAEKKNIKDPTVFFIVTVDDVTGSEEFKLHLMPDRKTPRVWKLSEIAHGYHKKGDSEPKIGGLHPNCRCKLTYLAEGWGFDAGGRVKFISLDHDELKAQRK